MSETITNFPDLWKLKLKNNGEVNDLVVASKLIKLSISARERNIPFDMSFPHCKKLLKTEKCYFTGEILNCKDGDPLQRTVDRIDASQGYTDKNTVACSSVFNKKKGNLTVEDMKMIFKVLKRKKLL